MSIYTKTTNGWEEIGANAGIEPGLPGLGGWAEITDVSGSPKRYAYPDPANPEWVAFEWTGDGELTTQAGGVAEMLLVAGAATDARGNGGSVVTGIHALQNGPNQVAVGVGGNGNGGLPEGQGKRSIVGPVATMPTAVCREVGGAFGSGGVVGGDYSPLSSDITGTTQTYGAKKYGAQDYSTTGFGDSHATSGIQGNSGCCIVRVPAAQAEKVSSDKWVTRSNYFAVVENGVVTETYTEHHYGNGTVSPLPQTDLIPCDANVTEGYVYENGEFVPPAPDPTAVEELVAELQAQIDTLRKA
jgi:hypothetical protein